MNVNNNPLTHLNQIFCSIEGLFEYLKDNNIVSQVKICSNCNDESFRKYIKKKELRDYYIDAV